MINLLADFFQTYNDIFFVIGLSLIVSLTATLMGAVLGIAAAVPTALKNFYLKAPLLRVTDTLMSLPPVLLGLLVYLMLSRKGPLGEFELLFTPTAMIITQTILVTPIIYGMAVSTLSKTVQEIQKTCLALGADRRDILITILLENRFQLLTIVTLGFGRAISEVGAVMMVGGNIKGYTRVMTTYIALETGKGNFDEAIIIGIVLLTVSFLINILLYKLQGRET